MSGTVSRTHNDLLAILSVSLSWVFAVPLTAPRFYKINAFTV